MTIEHPATERLWEDLEDVMDKHRSVAMDDRVDVATAVGVLVCLAFETWLRDRGDE